MLSTIAVYVLINEAHSLDDFTIQVRAIFEHRYCVKGYKRLSIG